MRIGAPDRRCRSFVSVDWKRRDRSIGRRIASPRPTVSFRPSLRRSSTHRKSDRSPNRPRKRASQRETSDNNKPSTSSLGSGSRVIGRSVSDGRDNAAERKKRAPQVHSVPFERGNSFKASNDKSEITAHHSLQFLENSKEIVNK